MKILCIHGIGHKERTMDVWRPQWEKAIEYAAGVPSDTQFEFLKFDDLFDQAAKDGIEYRDALLMLAKSWISSEFDQDRRARIFGIQEKIDDYAGMVAQFAVDEDLVGKLMTLWETTLNKVQPDIVFAHSLGALISYDYLRRNTVNGRKFDFCLVTAGAQINHPALRKRFGGRIEPVNVKLWLNLHNRNDRVFASRAIDLQAANFSEVDTPFSDGLFSINHEALNYIQHESAIAFGWPKVIETHAARTFAESSAGLTRAKVVNEPRRKALLVGINNYPDPANQLEGCVNDVFRMSEVLQETGFQPDDIRVVLNERATASGIRERLKWLLSDTGEKDLRFFFYSGHGAQIPAPTDSSDVDANEETLVPYDFDWTSEHAFTDKEFVEMYSQLNYATRFICAFDCCHSGGMTRDGAHKARGITPPDDIRHRQIKWDPGRQMWVDRDIPLMKRPLFKDQTTDSKEYTGERNNTFKLGRAVPLWTSQGQFEKNKKLYGHAGPFVPTVLSACKENELAYEYRHGVTSFGAFTYSITTILRQMQARGQRPSFEELIERTKTQLHELKYNQNPVIFPESRKDQVTF